MPTTTAPSPELLRNRNKTVARTLFRQLQSEGFTNDQIISLIGDLLENVMDTMKSAPATSDLARA